MCELFILKEIGPPVPSEQLPADVDRQHFQALGTISVFVLRCRASSGPMSSPASSSNVDDLAQDDHPEEESARSRTLGSATTSRFGLDGEGFGGPEMRAWSWSLPSVQSPWTHQPTPGQGHAYYSHPVPSWPPQLPASVTPSYVGQPGPAIHHGASSNAHPQRHVRFNDQCATAAPTEAPSAQGPTNSRDDGSHFTRDSYVASQQSATPSHATSEAATMSQPAAPAPGVSSSGDAYLSYTNAPCHPSSGPGASYEGVPYYYPPNQDGPLFAAGYNGNSPWPTATAYPYHLQPPWTAGPHLQHGSAMPYSAPSMPLSYQLSSQYPGYAPVHLGGGIWGPPPPPKNDSRASQQPQEHGKDENVGYTDQANPNTANDQQNNSTTQGEARSDDGLWQSQPDNSDGGGGKNQFYEEDAARSINLGHVSGQSPTSRHSGAQGSSAPEQSYANNNSWNLNSNHCQDTQGTKSRNDAVAGKSSPISTMPYTQAGLAFPQGLDTGRLLRGPHGVYYGRKWEHRGGGPPPDAGEEPPYDVPADIGSTHQVQPGEAYMYYHRRRSPEYLDSLEEPYARFIFKYRTRDQIEQETGIKIEQDPVAAMARMELQQLDKEQLIEMLQTKNAASSLTAMSPGHGNDNHRQMSQRNFDAVPAPARDFLRNQIPSVHQHLENAASQGFAAPSSTHPPANKNGSSSCSNSGNSVRDGGCSNLDQTAATNGSRLSSRPHHHHHHARTSSWGERIAPEPAGQAQCPSHLSQSAPPRPPSSYAPIQSDNTVRTYKPGASASAHPPRPVTPPSGAVGWDGSSAATAAAAAGGAALATNINDGNDGGSGGQSPANRYGGGAAYQPEGGW